MTFAGIKDARQRADLLAFLKDRTGPVMPLRSLAPRSSSSKILTRSLRVPSAITTMFGSAGWT
jgi:hypothetical protein